MAKNLVMRVRWTLRSHFVILTFVLIGQMTQIIIFVLSPIKLPKLAMLIFIKKRTELNYSMTEKVMLLC